MASVLLDLNESKINENDHTNEELDIEEDGQISTKKSKEVSLSTFFCTYFQNMSEFSSVLYKFRKNEVLPNQQIICLSPNEHEKPQTVMGAEKVQTITRILWKVW